MASQVTLLIIIVIQDKMFIGSYEKLLISGDSNLYSFIQFISVNR